MISNLNIFVVRAKKFMKHEIVKPIIKKDRKKN